LVIYSFWGPHWFDLIKSLKTRKLTIFCLVIPQK